MSSLRRSMARSMARESAFAPAPKPHPKPAVEEVFRHPAAWLVIAAKLDRYVALDEIELRRIPS